MASTRPAPGGGPPLRWGLACALCAALIGGCTSPNPFFMSARDGGMGGNGGSGGAASGGTGATSGAGGSGGAGNGGSGGAGVGGAGGSGGTGGAGGAGGSTAGAGGAGPGSGGSGPGTGGTGTSSGGSGGTGAGSGGTGGSGGASGTGGSQPDMSINPMDASDAPTMGSPPPTCGTTSADVSDILNARGIAVDATGTIFFSREAGNRSYIGRKLRGQAAVGTWFQLDNNTGPPRVIRIDNARELLHVSDPANGLLISVGYTRTPVFIRNSAGMLPGAHGVAVADDGAVFVSCSDGIIHRLVVDLVPSRNPALGAPVFSGGQRPMGMAFGPGGYLYVGSSNGRIKRFRVQNNMLVDPVDHGSYSGPATDLAFDVQGRLYIADGTGGARSITVMAPDGSLTTAGPAGVFTGLGFGRGMLSCQDLYASDAAGAARVIPAAALGLNLP